MAKRLHTLVLIATCSAACACAHAPSPALQVAQASALPELGEDMPDATPAAPAGKLLSIDMPVGRLCDHPQAKAVVDRDLPGLTSRPEFMFFKHMSLRQLQAASRGKMSEAALARVSVDLAAVGDPAATPLVQASATFP